MIDFVKYAGGMIAMIYPTSCDHSKSYQIWSYPLKVAHLQVTQLKVTLLQVTLL